MKLLAQARLWLFFRQDWLGLVLGGVIAFVLALAIALFLVPAGPSQAIEGTVAGFGMHEREGGSRRAMTVRTTEGTVTVSVQMSLDCRIGDRAALARVRHWWGWSHGLALGNPRPCRRPAAT